MGTRPQNGKVWSAPSERKKPRGRVPAQLGNFPLIYMALTAQNAVIQAKVIRAKVQLNCLLWARPKPAIILF